MSATNLQLHLFSERVVATALGGDQGVLAEASRPVETVALEPGWLEQREDDWWAACLEAIAELQAKTSLATVAQIAVTSDFAASVFLDGDRDVIRPAILDGDIRGPHPVGWLRRHQPIAYKRVQHLLQPADYVRLMLTGEIATTNAEARRSGLFDVAAGAWDARLCEALEINVDLLPPIRKGAVAILGEVATTLGVPEGPVVV